MRHALGFSRVSVEHTSGFSGGVGLWVGVVRSSPGHRLTFSENPGRVLGESRAHRKILGVICREFWENVGFLHHWTASFVGAPITTRERHYVTQLHARINVTVAILAFR